ncbi:hypothetical protein GA0074704_4867 [Micromonospora siamensis]|uniref:Uncharacterized protein n=2 Tax=Micromonospora siamensis TaxID=299152 RepID=A0A1C5JRK5_9ACTN|nr:hypothetical protein GA0074704_4867 [Micromonospora siamensis]
MMTDKEAAALVTIAVRRDNGDGDGERLNERLRSMMWAVADQYAMRKEMLVKIQASRDALAKEWGE